MRFVSTRRIVSRFGLAGAVIFLNANAWATSEPLTLKTPAGVVEVLSSAGPVCGSESYDIQCSILSVSGKRVAVDTYVSVTVVLPNREHPLVVGAESSSGGSCCPPEGYLIDVSGRRSFSFKGFTLPEKASIVGQDLVFDMIDGEDKLGDMLSSTFRYRLGSGRKPSKIASAVRHYEASLGGQTIAYDVLNNPELRKPILAIVGKDGFAEFRRHFGASGPTELVKNQYLVGSGIIPHDGPNGGIFVIDTKNNLAWAVVVDSVETGANARRWGVLTPLDSVPRGLIDKWLVAVNMQPWRVKDVPLDEKTLNEYFAPRAKQQASKPVAAALASPATGLSAGPVDAPLEKSGGTFTVPVTINDAIKLNFVVDSGAADVSIPADVVMTLMRTGTIESTDFLGEQTYQLADGSKVPSKTFRIRSLKVGDKTLENVVGSVASVNGSLLLGQSFLNRFKSWSIDNEKHVLVLK